ncbi:MAG: beta/gamma crystallin-related protein [Thermoanaerobaculia bacterium]|nr:beta/gamma crystallin-related protein [Thermoanaerobaculia bacterium]
MAKSAALFRALPFVLSVLAALTGAGQATAQGVTLFRDRFLQGPSQTFHDDVPDLRYTQLGSRRASSIHVPPGCVAVVYGRPGFRGRSTTFRDSDNDLSNTAVGEDSASSLRVNCRRSGPGNHYRPDWHVDHPGSDEPAPRRGVVLYRDREAGGPSQFFDRDVPDLDRTRFGSRMASSVDVSPGCIAVLHELPGFRGRRTEFRERDDNLRNTAVGEDTASSLQVRCR